MDKYKELELYLRRVICDYNERLEGMPNSESGTVQLIIPIEQLKLLVDCVEYVQTS